jgi:hypothetical protein
VAPAIAQHSHEQVGAAVDHLRLVGEFRHAVDHAEHLDDLDLVKAAGRQLRRREQTEADDLRMLVGLLDGDVASDLAEVIAAVGLPWALAR